MTAACLIVMGLLLVVSGFFSGSEAAFFSITAQERSTMSATRVGQIANRLLETPNQLLSAILFWNLGINIAYFSLASVLASLLAIQFDWPLMHGIVPALALSCIVLTGELLPKSTAVSSPLAFVRLAAVPLSLAVGIVRPLAASLEPVAELSRRMLWPQLISEKYIETEDLQRAIEISSDNSSVEVDEKLVLKNIVDFDKIQVAEWMRPYGQYKTYPPNAQLADLGGVETASGYCLLTNISAGEIMHSVRLADLPYSPNLELKKHAKRVLVTPWCTSLSDVLVKFQSRNRDVAVVVNERGETIGILSYEDTVEYLFRIQHTAETVEEITQSDDSTWTARGSTNLRRLGRTLDIPVQNTSAITIAGVVQDALQRLPREGDTCDWNGLRFHVLQVSGRNLVTVRIERLDSRGNGA